MLMKIDRRRLYTLSDDFFSLGGSVIMKLSSEAAVQVCEQAANYGLVVSRVEGGIWHFPGFEARIDCIWDGDDPPVDAARAKTNNAVAANFIRSESVVHDAFIITAPRFDDMTGQINYL